MKNEKIKLPEIVKYLTKEARKKLLNLPPGTRDVYLHGVCGVCKEKINASELQWCIDNNFLAVCLKHRAETQERIDKLWGHMAQLNLL